MKNKMLVQTLKGFRDFLPKEARKRQYVIATLREVFSSYGFEPLETPALEYEEILMGKYGDEADKLLYRFADNGGRRVAMRYDQTVPLSRVVAQYASANSPDGQPLLPSPFKRYQIQPVWRAENTQKGRFREFLQCDIDIVGSQSYLADAEIVSVINQAFERLGFTKFKVLINDRTIFGDLPAKAITVIDKLKKIGSEKVKEELQSLGIQPERLDELMSRRPTINLSAIIAVTQQTGIPADRVVFEPTLARGLDYYTGMIIEVEVEDYSAGSLGGGGRYDNLIGMFGASTGSGVNTAAVGFAFGFDRIMDAMDEQNLFPKEIAESTTRVLVTIFSPELQQKSLEISAQLRTSNIPAELYLDEITKIEKQLKYADQKGIPYVVVIGPDEAEKNMVTLKNLRSREQKQMSFEELLSLLQK